MLHKNPHSSMQHISDEDLVRSADGELSSKRDAEVAAHLEACWDCRARMEDFQSTIKDFVRAHHVESDGQLPPANGPRALLRARLGQLGSDSPDGWWKHFSLARAAVVVPLVAIAIGTFWLQQPIQRELRSASAFFEAGSVPNRNLTPGATHQMTISEMCSDPEEEVVGDVSLSLQHRVLQEYGIANARPEDYEIDYLIAPRLGGTEDIRNLWPEPYRTRVWNAHVKDTLEQRLHEMVCSGQLDASTAQHDIATDWIAAYKKYFRTNKPVPLSSSVALSYDQRAASALRKGG